MNVHRAIGSVMEGWGVGYDRSGRARMENARNTITLGHIEAGAGRTMSTRRRRDTDFDDDQRAAGWEPKA